MHFNKIRLSNIDSVTGFELLICVIIETQTQIYHSCHSSWGSRLQHRVVSNNNKRELNKQKTQFNNYDVYLTLVEVQKSGQQSKLNTSATLLKHPHCGIESGAGWSKTALQMKHYVGMGFSCLCQFFTLFEVTLAERMPSFLKLNSNMDLFLTFNPHLIVIKEEIFQECRKQTTC